MSMRPAATSIVAAIQKFKQNPNQNVFCFLSSSLAAAPEVHNSGIPPAFQASSLSWSSQEVAAIGPGIGPRGEVPAARWDRLRLTACAAFYFLTPLSLSHTLTFFSLSFLCALALLTLFRNSAETADTSLDCRCTPDLFASCRPLGLASPGLICLPRLPRPLEGVSAG